MSAQRILDVQTGSFTNFVEECIFKPLGMGAMYSPEAAIATGRAAFGFTKEGNRALPFFYNKDNYQLSAGPGGVIASAEDLVSPIWPDARPPALTRTVQGKWVRMLLHAGVNSDSENIVIPETAFEAMTTAHVVVNGTGSVEKSIEGYGLGWGRTSYHGHDIVSLIQISRGCG